MTHITSILDSLLTALDEWAAGVMAATAAGIESKAIRNHRNYS